MYIHRGKGRGVGGGEAEEGRGRRGGGGGRGQNIQSVFFASETRTTELVAPPPAAVHTCKS